MIIYKVILKIFNALEESDKPEYIVREYSNENPLIARKEAMDLVQDYLEMLRETGRLDESSFTKIIQPKYIADKWADFMEKKTEENPFGHIEFMLESQERLLVEMIPPYELAKKHDLIYETKKQVVFGEGMVNENTEDKVVEQTLIDIHNDGMDEEAMIDGLNVEFSILEEEGVITDKDAVDVICYSCDYYDGEEGGEFHDILPIPLSFRSDPDEKVIEKNKKWEDEFYFLRKAQ